MTWETEIKINHLKLDCYKVPCAALWTVLSVWLLKTHKSHFLSQTPSPSSGAVSASVWGRIKSWGPFDTARWEDWTGCTVQWWDSKNSSLNRCGFKGFLQSTLWIEDILVRKKKKSGQPNRRKDRTKSGIKIKLKPVRRLNVGILLLRERVRF